MSKSQQDPLQEALKKRGKTLEQIEQEQLERSRTLSSTPSLEQEVTPELTKAERRRAQKNLEAQRKDQKLERRKEVKAEKEKATPRPIGVLDQAKKDLSGVTMKGLEHKLNKAKTLAEASAVTQEATKLLAEAKKDFAEKSSKHESITSSAKQMNEITRDSVKEHVKVAYLAEKYPSGVPADLSSKDISAIDKEVEKRAEKEYKELKDAVKDISGDGVLSRIRGRLSDEHKSLEAAHQKLTGLDQKLTQLDTEKNKLMSRREAVVKEIDSIKEEYGYKGVSGFFKKQANRVFGSKEEKEDIKALEQLYKAEKETKDQLKDTAKEFDKSMKGYLDARESFDKVSARAQEKLQKHQAKFAKYSTAAEQSPESKALEERRAKISQARTERMGRIEGLVGSLTKTSEARRGPGSGAPAPATGRGVTTPDQTKGRNR